MQATELAPDNARKRFVRVLLHSAAIAVCGIGISSLLRFRALGVQARLLESGLLSAPIDQAAARDGFRVCLPSGGWALGRGEGMVYVEFAEAPEAYHSTLECVITVLGSSASNEDVLLEETLDGPPINERTFRLDIGRIGEALLVSHDCLHVNLEILREDPRLGSLRVAITPSDMAPFVRARLSAVNWLCRGVILCAIAVAMWTWLIVQAKRRGMERRFRLAAERTRGHNVRE